MLGSCRKDTTYHIVSLLYRMLDSVVIRVNFGNLNAVRTYSPLQFERRYDYMAKAVVPAGKINYSILISHCLTWFRSVRNQGICIACSIAYLI